MISVGFHGLRDTPGFYNVRYGYGICTLRQHNEHPEYIRIKNTYSFHHQYPKLIIICNQELKVRKMMWIK